MFSSVPISHILKNENYELCFSAGSFVDQITTGKKDTAIWPSVRMFGGSMSLECFRGFLDQITTRKIKRYSHLAIGCNVWGAVSMCSDCFDRLDCFDGFESTTGKRYSHLAISWNVYYVLLIYYTLVDRLSTMMPWGIYPGRKIPALTSGK